MKARIREMYHRLVGPETRSELRRRWYRIRPARIGSGVGSGLKFDPGPSNPDYGRGNNELPVQQALERHATSGSVVFDIGANVGFFTVLAARLVGPDGHVVAFEPVPSNAEYVRRNARLNDMENIAVVEKAVSDATGHGDLVLASYSGGAALSIADTPPDATESVTVPLTTIDEAVETGAVPPPGIVKIDVEGAELEVLRGMESTLRHHRPTIICEIDGPDEAGVADKLAACIAFVEARGFRTEMLDDSYAGTWHVRHFVAEPETATPGRE